MTPLTVIELWYQTVLKQLHHSALGVAIFFWDPPLQPPTAFFILVQAWSSKLSKLLHECQKNRRPPINHHCLEQLRWSCNNYHIIQLFYCSEGFTIGFVCYLSCFSFVSSTDQWTCEFPLCRYDFLSFVTLELKLLNSWSSYILKEFLSSRSHCLYSC